MKSLFTLLLSFALTVSFSQMTSVTKRTDFTVSIDENTLVKDINGQRVPYAFVMKMMATGQYTIDLVKDTHGNAIECKLREVKKEDVGKRETYMRTPGTENLPKPLIGQALPNFEMGTLDSKLITSDDVKGKVTVFCFWYGNCKTCINEIPLLNELSNKYASTSDVVFLAPTTDYRDSVSQFINTHHFNYTVCPYATALTDALKVEIYPTHLVVGRDGRIISSYSGGLPGVDDLIKRDIDAALKKSLSMIGN